jgi:hypothetical protein
MSGHHPNVFPKLSNEPNADRVIKNVTVLCASKILGLFNIFSQQDFLNGFRDLALIKIQVPIADRSL